MSLTRPSFVTFDPDEITSQLVEQYEQIVGKTLHPAQPERLFIDVIAYRECLIRQAIQEAAEQNLVAYARDVALDHLGANVGITRLAAQAATCTVQLTLASAPSTDDSIASGVQLKTGDNAFTFTTTESCFITAGQTTGTCAAQCTATGEDANGYLVSNLSLKNTATSSVNGISVSSATNTTATALGSDSESDDDYRERIPVAMEAFSSAGPTQAYRYHALHAHSSIVDVAVVSPSAGVVNIYPLCSTGAPSSAILTLVNTACNGDKVRPLTDDVHVIAPTAKNFTVAATIKLYGDADRSSVLTAINKQLSDYRDTIQLTMGKDIVPSQISALIHVDGVYSVALTSPELTRVASNEYPVLTSWTITVGEVLYEQR